MSHFFYSPRFRRLARMLALGLSITGFSGAAAAETYRIDVIVFVDLLQASSEAGQAPTPPNLKNAVLADDVAALRAAGIEILPDAQFGLDAEWKNLRFSKQFKPLARIAWTQKDPPGERGPAVRIKPGNVPLGNAAVSGLPPAVDGSIALLLVKNYLTIDADLQYVADAQQWSLNERRRMRRDEIHHLDSARLGILTKVSKAQTP